MVLGESLVSPDENNSAEWFLSEKVAYKLPKDGGSPQFYPSVTPIIHRMWSVNYVFGISASQRSPNCITVT